MTNLHPDMKTLYEGLIQGDRDKVIKLFDSEFMAEDCMTEWNPLTTLHDTVLHIATYSQHEELVLEILKMTKTETLMKANDLGDTILHEAATTNMINVADEMLNKASELLKKRNHYGETPLFRAAHFGQTAMFNRLADKDPIGAEVQMTRRDGTNVLHIAILAEFFETALEIVKRYPNLLEKRDENGMTGLQLLSSIPSAFKSGSNVGLVRRFIYYCIPNGDTNVPHVNLGDGASSPGSGIDDPSNGSRSPKFPPTYNICVEVYTIISRMVVSVLGKINQVIWKQFLEGWPFMEGVCKEKKTHESALRLMKVLVRKDTSWSQSNPGGDPGKINLDKQHSHRSQSNPGGHPDKINRDNDRATEQNERMKEEHSDRPEMPSNETPSNETRIDIKDSSGKKEEIKDKHQPETPLLIATSNGIVEIVKEILEVYPQAVEHVSASGQNILHVAVKKRQKEIFDLVKKMAKPIMERLTRRIDKESKTILHQVAFMENYRGSNKPGPALQLQEELLWFKRVQDVVLAHYSMHRNSEGYTAAELFALSHENLVKNGQEWLKRTSESCSLVAVLIATVAFAAAYTIPGGPNQITGLPVLLDKPFFLVFTVMDVLSLASSLTSVVMFLSILTSPFQLKDFEQSLPRKLTLGFTFLFFSVTTMMFSFAATIILTIRMNGKWSTLLIYTVAYLPVTIFALLQFPLYVALTASIKYTLGMIWKALPRCNLVPPPFRTRNKSFSKTH